MTHTVEPRLAKPFTLRKAHLPDGRNLENVTVRITARMEDASTPGADLYEAVLTHENADGTQTTGLPRVICKRVPVKPPSTDVPAELGLREELAYLKIRKTSTQIPMPLAHLVGYTKDDQEYLFIIERYDVNAFKRIKSLKPDERAASVQHFFAAGYLALRHLNQRVNISMRDAHPKNFVYRKAKPGEPGFEFVAVDFGHASVGEVHTLERPLRAMAVIQHPEVLAFNGLHHGLEDDLFSLAVSSHILLSKVHATPWVDHFENRIHFNEDQECRRISYGMADAANLLQPDWGAIGGGAHADFLTMLEELLQPRRTREERRRYVTEELPALVARLEPWTEKSIAEMEQSGAPAAQRSGSGAATLPNPPVGSTLPMPSPAHSDTTVRSPHHVPYLAELQDFRPPPPAPGPPQSLLAKQQRAAVDQQRRAAFLQVVPFAVLTVMVVLTKFLPAVGLDALTDSHILPPGWQLPSNILLLLALAAGTAGLLIFGSEGRTSLPSALTQGLLAGFLACLTLVVAPAAAVVGAEALLYAMPGTTWRFEDWSFWPQWVLVLGLLATAFLGAFAILADEWRHILLKAGVACVVGTMASTMISAAAPFSFSGQHAIEADCGPSTYEFSHATQSLCIPVSQDWKQMENFGTDPFAAWKKFPTASALGSGPTSAAAGLSSGQFPCLSLFVHWNRPEPNQKVEIAVPEVNTDPQSQAKVLSAKGPDGRVDRVRLGGGSYVVYKDNTAVGDAVSGTTVYSAINAGGPFANPEDFLSSNHQGTSAFQVQRDCSAADQSSMDQAVEKLISSMKLNERFRMDVSEMQYSPAALATKNLDASRIEIPVPSGTSAAFYAEKHPMLLVEGVLAVAGVLLTNNNDFEKTTYATVAIADVPPENYAAATHSSVDPAWWVGALVTSDQGFTQEHYQKQTVGGHDYYVRVALVVRDQGSYDDGAKQRFKKVLAGVHVANGGIDILKGSN